jgi:hypothetical protein
MLLGFSSKIKNHYDGFFQDIVQAFASRAAFSVKNSFGISLTLGFP